MTKSLAILALMISSTACFADGDDRTQICDLMATLSAKAVQAKDDGMDFVDFMDKVETIDAPAELKVLLKYFVADAFANGITPEHAYTNAFKECLVSQKSK